MKKATYYCTASVTYWNASEQDYDQIDLDHYSRAENAEAAEDGAREEWSEHGHNPEQVNVRPL